MVGINAHPTLAGPDAGAVTATTPSLGVKKRLICQPCQAILTSEGKPEGNVGLGVK